MKKTLGYFHIVLHLTKISIADLINMALGLVYDTDLDYTVHPYTQAQLAALANTVRTEIGTRLTAPNPTLTKQEQIDVDALSTAIIEIASGVTIAANKKAKGNRTLFDIVVKRIGFTSAAARAKHVRIFEIVSVGKGIWHIIAPIEKGMGKITYVFQLGKTTAIGVSPTVYDIELSSTSPEFYLSGLPLGTIFAIRYEAVIVPSHKKKVVTGGANTQRTVGQTSALHNTATVLPLNSKGKVQVTYGAPFYLFCNPIYMVVS
ncbi:MAG TPA: hypothetical protein VF411_12655 [Bacteroidia bacterium]